MNYKYTVHFANKTLLALCLLEIYQWGQQGKKFSINASEHNAYLKTSSNDIVDIITETFIVNRQYTIEKE